MLEKCFLTIVELNWNQRLGHEKTKLNICHHMLTSSTQLQNWSFYDGRRKNENVYKMSKNEKCTCKARKNTVFHCQIWKFVGFSFPLSSWLLKLPNSSMRLTSFPSVGFAGLPIKSLIESTFLQRARNGTLGSGPYESVIKMVSAQHSSNNGKN